jgi:hypothetical protein
VGQILEQPLADGSSRVLVRLHYENHPFVIFTLQSIESSWFEDENGELTVDSRMLVPVVVDGRASLQTEFQIYLKRAGGPLAEENLDWERPGLFTVVVAGRGILTGEGGYPASVPALVHSTQVAPVAFPRGGLLRGDGFPVESIRIQPMPK